MGLFEQLPYTNFHDLNLTEIVKFLKDIAKQFDEFVALNTVTYKGVWSITTNYTTWSIVSDPDTGNGYISLKPVPNGIELTNTEYWLMIYDFIDELDVILSRLNALETSVKERFRTNNFNGKALFIGDSWGGCWNHVEGTGSDDQFYQNVVASLLGISEHWNYYEGGTGFAYANGKWYGHQLELFVQDHADECENITNIFIIGGQNDLGDYGQDYVNSNQTYECKWCYYFIRNNFPNAKVWVGMVARTAMYNIDGGYGNITDTIKHYKDACRQYGWNYIPNCHHMVHDYSMICENDGRHLTHAGYARLGRYLAESLLNGFWEFENRGYADITIRPASECSGTLLGDDVSSCGIKQFISKSGVTLLLDQPYFFDFTAVNREAEKIYVLCKYGSSPSDINYHPANLFSSLYRIKIPVNIILISNNGTQKNNLPAVIRLHEDGQMSLQFFDTNNAGNAWTNFIQCTRVIIEPFTYTIPLDLC